VNSRVTEDFVDCFSRLPKSVKTQSRKSYRLWRENPAHPGLQFKLIQADDQLYSVRVSLGWRALGLLEDDTVYWFWIGSHAEYDKNPETMVTGVGFPLSS
jgi:hypothetical protein